MPEISVIRYAIRKVAGCLDDEDERADFLLVAYQDPIRALREAIATGELPVEVMRLAEAAADQQVRQDIARRLRVRS